MKQIGELRLDLPRPPKGFKKCNPLRIPYFPQGSNGFLHPRDPYTTLYKPYRTPTIAPFKGIGGVPFLDPFRGSGSFLQEGLFKDAKRACGEDLNLATPVIPFFPFGLRV